MTHIYKIILTFVICMPLNAQVTNIKPLRTLTYECDNGTYIKDIDNEFPFWLDTWEGTVNGYKYIFTFSMFSQHLTTYPNGEYMYRDTVVGKLKVISLLTNETVYDESNFSNFEDFKISSSLVKGIVFYFFFQDDAAHCYQLAEFQLVKDAFNSNKIYYTNFSGEGYEYWDCPYTNYNIPLFLPTTDFELIRQ